jgi:hypothetical protein
VNRAPSPNPRRASPSAPGRGALSPPGGSTEGGQVTLTGSNLLGITHLWFAHEQASSPFCSTDTHCTATAPHPEGTVDVVAASAAGPSRATAGSRYTYGTPELEIASGDHQRLVYGQHLEPLVVGALLDGQPLAGFTVSFEPTALGGPIYKDLLVNIPKFETGPTGIARAPGFWALSTPGT